MPKTRIKRRENGKFLIPDSGKVPAHNKVKIPSPAEEADKQYSNTRKKRLDAVNRGPARKMETGLIQKKISENTTGRK